MTVRSVLGLVVVCFASWCVPALAAPADINAEMTPAEAQKILTTTRPRAEKGDASAQYNLGVLYDRGLGVEQDYDQARKWYRKAADQRYGRAEHNLGIMYESGKGVAKNTTQAAHWFRRGADDGQAASQNNLGVLYMKGDGVPQNSGKAAFWTARAAAAGNGAAIENLPRIVDDLPQSHVNAKDVNVRDQPDSQARVVRQADSDATVVILAREPEWTQVLFPKTYETGWVANFLLADGLAPLAGASDAEPKGSAGANASSDEPSPDEPEANDKRATAVDETPAATRPASTAQDQQSVDTSAKKAKAAPDTSDKAMHVGVGSANLRAKASRSARVIGQLHRDDVVTALERHNDWVRVRTQDGMLGWLAGYLLVDGR